jgi:sortase A
MTTIIYKILIAAGCLISLHASWLPAKAWLSQVLISYSWQKSQTQNSMRKNEYLTTRASNNIAIKPWPWADTFPIAELSIERLEENIVILNGGDPTTLAFSAGAIAPFNQANSITPFVVAGHNDSHFAFLENILMKDIISMRDQHGKSQLYQVEAIDIIDASTGKLPILANDSSLILITCYPFNNLSNNRDERYIITAKLL